MCITSVLKLSLLDFFFFSYFLQKSNPRIYIYRDSSRKKNKTKGSVLSTLVIHMRITCQKFNFQLEKTAREIFGLGSNPGCRAEWNIYENEGSHGPYSRTRVV